MTVLQSKTILIVDDDRISIKLAEFVLKKEGYESSFGDFMRIGIPYTLTAVIVGYLYLWIVWA